MQPKHAIQPLRLASPAAKQTRGPSQPQTGPGPLSQSRLCAADTKLITKSDNPVVLECYHCGRPIKLGFEAGHGLFHAATYAWLLVLDFYRWKIDEHIGGAYVYEHVTPLARRFGRYLHTRGTRALSIRDLETLEQQDVQVRTFHARAARFNKIFGELPPKLRPFCYDGIDGGHGPLIPAYRMRSSRRWLVIVGVVGGGNDGVDWASFLEPALCV